MGFLFGISPYYPYCFSVLKVHVSTNTAYLYSTQVYLFLLQLLMLNIVFQTRTHHWFIQYYQSFDNISVPLFLIVLQAVCFYWWSYVFSVHSFWLIRYFCGWIKLFQISDVYMNTSQHSFFNLLFINLEKLLW